MCVQGYDKYGFEPFAVTVDLAVFTIRDGALRVLLVERGQDPYAGRLALPGGFVLPDESAETAAARELAEETGLSDVTGLHLEQLRTYSDPDRDPRMRVVSVAFAALVPDPPEVRGGGDAARADWLPYGTGAYGPLAFDHDRILGAPHGAGGPALVDHLPGPALMPPGGDWGGARG
ncbi:NUDIX domain-containing protein, partial [Streptomyces sp. NPDC059349]|uniref:NUDIX domain-containing protein n=1 Tax=Streptomyces sp. NPDC059349 TaxID=3346808 RepID=UPI00369A1C3B